MKPASTPALICCALRNDSLTALKSSAVINPLSKASLQVSRESVITMDATDGIGLCERYAVDDVQA